MLSKGQAIVQGTYIFLFIFMSIGIAGNIVYEVKTPGINIAAYAIVCFLVLGKFIYWIKNDKLF